MKYIRRLFGSAMLVMLLSTIASPAQAVGEAATRVSISPLETLTVGSEASLVVTLTRVDGTAVANEPITLTIDGDSRPRRWTDTAGVSTFNLPRDLAPGEHEIVAAYAGRTNAYLGASARTVVDIVPYELAIETVPPLPGMVFEIDGTRFEAGANGVARVGLPRLGDYTLTALTAAYHHPGQRVEFSRWSNETFGPTINIRVPLGVSLQAGFDVSYQASQAFVDPRGDTVDEARIEEVTLRSSIGETSTFADGRPRWYKAIRTVRRPSGLASVPIRYTVERVVVDGANVVNVGQQRFEVESGTAWPIELLLFSVRMVPNDALFGFPLGESIILTHPTGSTTRIDAVDGQFAANGLARGLYRVQLADAPGWSPVTPVALSRDQEVRVRVITYLDIAVVFLLGLGAALGLLHVGRPHLAPAAMSGARGFLGVVRNPRTVGALITRRRATARPVPHTAPQLSTQPRGAAPIAEVIRMTLGAPLPATRAEAFALRPPPLPIGASAPGASPPTSEPVHAVRAPRPAGAAAPTVVGLVTSRPALQNVGVATGEAAAASAPTGGDPGHTRRVRPRIGATAAKPPSRRARRTADAPTDLAPPAAPAAEQRRRRSPKATPATSSIPALVAQTPKTKPSRAKAPGKRTSISTKADAAPPELRDAKVIAPSETPLSAATSYVDVPPTGAKTKKKTRAKTNVQPTSEHRPRKTPGPPKKRAATTTAKATAAPKKRAATTTAKAAAAPKKRAATTTAKAAAAPKKRAATTTAKATAAPKKRAATTTAKATAAPKKRAATTTAKATAAPKKRAATTTAKAAAAPKKRAATTTAKAAAAPKKRAATTTAKAAAAPKKRAATTTAKAAAAPKKRAATTTAKAAAAPKTKRPATTTAKAAAAPKTKRPATTTAAGRSKPPVVTSVASQSGAISGTTGGLGVTEVPARDEPSLQTASEQTTTAFSTTAEPGDARAASGTRAADDWEGTERTAAATAWGQVDDGSRSAVDRPVGDLKGGDEVDFNRSPERAAGRVVAPPLAWPDRAARAGEAAILCTGCRAPIKPGARFCRRCGHVTAVGELERAR